MIKLTATELQNIIDAAIYEMEKHPNDYKIAKPKAKEIRHWLMKTNWDNPNEPAIMIDELPF